RAKARQHDGPVVVVELAREEKRPGEAVVLRAMVAVVLVRADRVPPEAVVLAHVEWQLVAVAEQDRFAVAADYELRRNGSVERPDRIQVLGREAGMELHRNRGGRIDARIELRRDLGVV